MCFIKELVELFTKHNLTIKIEENLQTYKCIILSDDISIPTRSQIKRIFDYFPIRDSIIVSIMIDEDEDETALFSSKTQDSYDKFVKDLKYIKQLKSADNKYELKIKIIKEIYKDYIYSIYSLEHFTEYLNNLELKGALYVFNEAMKDKNKIIFQLFNTEDLFYTKSIFFCSTLNQIHNTNQRDTDNLKKRNEVSTFLNAAEYNFTPNDFTLIKHSKNETINYVFNKLSFIFSIIFIANISSIDNDNDLNIRIDGYKTINTSIDFNLIKINNNLQQYFKIFEWIYNEGNIADKIGLARNIITLHLKNNNLFYLQENTLDSIKSSHQIYLRQNVQQYIQVKNKVEEFLMNMSQKINEVGDNFSNTLKKNLIAFLSFFVSVFVINSISGGNFNNIFTRDICSIVFIILIISFMFLISSIFDVKFKTERLKEQYQKLKENYNDVLEEKDIEKIFNDNNIPDGEIEYINKRTKFYSVVWSIIILTVFIVICILG